MFIDDFSLADGYVFDFGGVITVSPMPDWDRTFYPYCESLGLDRRFVLEGFRRYRSLWDGDEISFAEMYARIFADAGLPPPSPEALAEIERLDKYSWAATLRADTLELMRAIKASGKRIAILSNMSSDFYRDCFEPRCAEYRALVDVEVISGFEHVCKPDPRIYRIAEERLALPPSRLMFFDDSPANVQAAESLGWQARLYTGG